MLTLVTSVHQGACRSPVLKHQFSPACEALVSHLWMPKGSLPKSSLPKGSLPRSSVPSPWPVTEHVRDAVRRREHVLARPNHVHCVPFLISLVPERTAETC